MRNRPLMSGIALSVLLANAPAAHAQSWAESLATGAFKEMRDGAPHPQILATFNTFFGRPDLNAGLHDLSRPSADCPTGEAKPANGADWVLAYAADAKIVMFNENHYGVEARAFVRQLLDDLYRSGFSHLGFEAFIPLPGGEAYAPAMGAYTVEPVFAAMVRDAAALGYEIFGYETTVRAPEGATSSERIRVREHGQAANLGKQIDSAGSDARFVVFAGWSHIAEAPIPGSEGEDSWMAARLKEATGIDPFTVDLTACGYPAADPEGWSGRVYLSEAGRPLVSGRYAGAVDAQVHLPVPQQDDPAAAGFYRSSLGNPVDVPADLRPDDTPVLVQAYRADQQEGEVAYDRILLRPGEQLPLYLPAGSYRLIAHEGDGSLIGRSTVEVE